MVVSCRRSSHLLYKNNKNININTTYNIYIIISIITATSVSRTTHLDNLALLEGQFHLIGVRVGRHGGGVVGEEGDENSNLVVRWHVGEVVVSALELVRTLGGSDCMGGRLTI